LERALKGILTVGNLSAYYARPMSKAPAVSLPLHVPASASVARRARFGGTLPISKLPRLAEAVAGSEGELRVSLQAQPNAGGAPSLTGTIEGEVTLDCQRCLQPFLQSLNVAVDLRLVESDEDEQRLLQDCEPYQVIDDRLPLHEIIEDEVLLALPLSPRCGRPDCTP
jgi:uncharacterized protein